MRKIVTVEGVVAPLDVANIDTDIIMPKQYLKSVKRTGYADYIFDGWRYLDAGGPDIPVSQRQQNPDFVLNQPAYQSSNILLTGDNFGCGSSREHAPWGLAEWGFEVIIAPSFADIFYNNCLKNGILLVSLSQDIIETLMQAVQDAPGYTLKVCLESQKITTPTGLVYDFEIASGPRQQLMSGQDEIAQSLACADAIKAYEKKRMQSEPWIFETLEVNNV